MLFPFTDKRARPMPRLPETAIAALSKVVSGAVVLSLPELPWSGNDPVAREAPAALVKV